MVNDMTAPKTCPDCGAALDPGEVCECKATGVVEPTPPSEMEFVMDTDLDKALPASIEFNFEQLKSQLIQSLERYQGLVVTADDIKGAKADRAKLNALRTALEDKRKEVKRRCMEPYNAFEARVKELVGLIDQPIAAINGQLKSYEEQRLKEKYAQAHAHYEEVAGDLLPLVPFDMVWVDDFSRASVSIGTVKKEITKFVNGVKNDLSVLETVESEFKEALKLKYLRSFDLSDVLAERARLQDQVRRLREFEAEQRKRDAISKLKGTENPQEPQENADAEGCALRQETAQKPQEAQTDKVYRLSFECYVTMDQAAALSGFLRANNITYRRI